MSFLVTLPIKVNANARGHTMQLGKRVKVHRSCAALAVKAAWRKFANHSEAAYLASGLVVTLTRVAPRKLDDHDNLRTAMKPIVDGITDALGLKNDRTALVVWEYGQRVGRVREYAVEIEIGTVSATADSGLILPISVRSLQPAPKPGVAVPTWDLVKIDIAARDAMGAHKYKVRHQHDNGRDHLRDAYEESLDLVVYLRAEIERRATT